MEFIVYLLKVNIAIGLLYGMYFILFQKDTFFQWKRLTLLAIIFISFLYPAISFFRQWMEHSSLKNMMENVSIQTYTLQEITVTGNVRSFSDFLPQIGIGVYALIAGVLLARMLLQIGTILYKVHNMTRTELFGQTIYENQGLKTPFSFFRWIALDSTLYSEAELEEILLHETTHAKQGHSTDTILAELVCVFCWFNPFAWLLKTEIRMNLEFLADRSALKSGCGAEHYQFHLLRLSYHKAIAQISNNFNVSPLKKRIFMMNKQQTSHRSMWKYALVLPVIATLLIFNSAFQTKASAAQNEWIADQPPVDEKAIFSQVETMPEFPGGERALMEWLRNNIRYPEEVAEKHIEGRIIVRFIIEADGSVNQDQVEIIKGEDPLLRQEAIRVVKSMPQWTPGKQNDNPVAVYYTLPIVFKLQSGKAENTPNAEKPTLSDISNDTVIELDGKVISKDELKQLKAEDIQLIQVVKDVEPYRIVITSKK